MIRESVHHSASAVVSLRATPIQRKLTRITMVTTIVALLITCGVLAMYEWLDFRASMVSDLTSIAAIIADNSSAALSFRDPASAEQTLGSLKARAHIATAVIYDADDVFARYHRSPGQQESRPPGTRRDGHLFGGNALHLYAPIEVAGERAGTVYLQSDLLEMRDRLVRYFAIALGVTLSACILAFHLARRLQGVIAGPISHLASIVGRVAGKDYSVRATRQGNDELGELTDGLNYMLDQLQEAHRDLEERVAARTAELQKEILERKHAQQELERIHQQLIVASRHAGMAEIATNVLHNVGNVLNSVNVSANLVTTQTRESCSADVVRLAELLREHQDDLAAFLARDPRGKHVVEYLGNLAQHLQAEQVATITELEALRTNIDHIKEIVAMQQAHAKLGGVHEIVKVVDLIEDSVRINASALARHGIEVRREVDADPFVNLDKHKVVQILVNLVRNAKHACQECGRSDRRITLRVTTSGGRVRIDVIDNGVGIAAGNLTRIFNYGFTTRASGHGFGLHSGALAARELSGTLTAQSEGLGHGATFTLDLPLHAASDASNVERMEDTHA